MELYFPKINKFYSFLFTGIIVFIGYNNIFTNWELQLYGFNELEDLGRLLFVLGISVCESALMTVILWWGIKSLKKISVNQMFKYIKDQSLSPFFLL
ncbi:hypothetical protein V7114_22660 [Neobacillus niacini]|uniref:hypothetical protein n=1 Tax=Neobacillus niacini TaxID=86668 RepID=UPI002FFD6EB4